MPDLTLISAALSSIKTATDIAQMLKKSDLSLEKAETKLKIAELISALADTKIEIANIQGILLESEGKIRELEEIIGIQKNIQWESPYYWLLKHDRNKEGPYCQRCYDVEQKLIRLQGDKNDLWTCMQCKSKYPGPNYTSPRSSIRTLQRG